MSGTTVLHVGFQKTGSTWLQAVFERSPTVFDVDRMALVERLIDPGRFLFEPDEARASLLAGHGDHAVVVSHEWLVGHPFANGYDTQVITGRLQQVFGDECRVLLVIRRQEDMIRAHYGEWVSHGGSLSARRFMATPAGWRWHPGFRFDYFEYHRVIAHYQHCFGADNVDVCLYEDLRQNPGAFVRDLGQRLGLSDLVVDDVEPAHRSLSSGTLMALRQSNRLVSRWGHNPAAVVLSPGAHGRLTRTLRRFEARLSPQRRRSWLHSERTQRIIAASTAGRFAASNRRTEALTGLDLGRHNYQR